MDDLTDLRRTDVETLALGAGIGTAGRVIGRALALSGQVVLARILGPASLGLYAIGLSTLKIAGQYAALGLEKGIVRFGPTDSGGGALGLRGVLRQTLLLAFLMGGVFGFGVFVLAPWLAEIVFDDLRLVSVLRLFSVAFPFYACLRVAAAATTISKRTTYYVVTQELLQPGLELALILGAFALGLRLEGMVAATVLSLALALWVAMRLLVRLFPSASEPDTGHSTSYRRLMAFSIPVAAGGLLATLMTWGDRYMLGIFRPTVEVGIYQAASQSSTLFAILLSGFNVVLNPMIADHDRAGRQSELEHLFRVATKWGLYLSIPFFLVIFWMPREVILVVFGDGFSQGAAPMVILALGQLVNVSTGAVGPLLVMTGRPVQWTSISAAMLLVSVVLGVLLIPSYGLVGAAISTSTAVAGKFILGLAQVRRSLGMWPYDRRYLKGLLAAGVALAPLVLVRAMPSVLPLTRLALGGLACAATFGLTLLALKIDPEDQQLLVALRRRIVPVR
jgi:O-antigen/teichoic acid export membrane protein